MQRILAILAHGLHGLAFAAWLGGILVIGALVAPAAFSVDRPFAARVMTASFQKLNTVSFVCGAAMLAATWVEWRVRSAQARQWLFVRAVLTAAALALALFLALRLLPTLIGLRSAGQKAEFDRLHSFSAIIFQVQAMLLVAGAFITAHLALPRRLTGPSDVGTGTEASEQPIASITAPLRAGPRRDSGAKRP